MKYLPRPISEISLNEVLYYEETIKGEKKIVAYWPIRKDADGVVLLRANALDDGHQMNKTNEATYIGSEMDTWLNDETAGYLSSLDEKMRAAIIPTTIKVKPYDSDTVTEIARQIYLLSESEVTNGGVEGDSILPMLKAHSGETNDNNARKAYNSAGSAVYWWLRSAFSAEQFRSVYTGGYVYSSYASSRNSPRPAFKVANATMVSDATEDTIYILPDPGKLYRELSFVAYCGNSQLRPKKAKVQVEIVNATEQVVQISNNAKDAAPVWVTCEPDQVVDLDNVEKSTEMWELGVKIYAKSGGRAVCGEPIVIVEVES